MHIEVLVEDSSGSKLLETLLPKIIGTQGNPHTWRIHPYKGIGHLPAGLSTKDDPAKRALLNQLPRLLTGYAKTPGVDAVLVVVDSDRRDCKVFLQELMDLLRQCQPQPNALFRLAIEEVEAWYFGDLQAVSVAYPRLKQEVINRYQQDSICNTWEMLADAVYPGGSAAIRKAGWPLPGHIKHEWAEKIGSLMDVENNQSPSFCKLRDGLRRLVN